MSDLLHVDWRDSQDETKYPFAEGTTLIDETGRRTIPERIFIDAYFHPATGAGDRLRLSSVEVQFDRLVFHIGDEAETELAQATSLYGQEPEILMFVDSYGRHAGMMVCQPLLLSSISSWGIGVYTFTADDTEFAAKCVCPVPVAGVEGFVVNGEVVDGDVYLVGMEGVILELVTETIPGDCRHPSYDAKVIRAHAVGDPLLKRRRCEDQAGGVAVLDTPGAITGIDIRQGTLESSSLLFTLLPDAQGYINIVPVWSEEEEGGESVLRIKTSPEGVAINAIG
jgi:hypothetical protein